MIPKDEFLLEIESIALSGEGIAKHEGVVFFVDGALPGERVRAEVVKVEKNLIRAKTLAILKNSPERVEAPCPYFGRCGGCVFQHYKYEHQLEAKRKELEQMFKHLGGFSDVVVAPPVASPKPYFYRNTVAMSVRCQGSESYLGFIGKDNSSFISIDRCFIADEKINESLPAVKQKFKEVVPEKKRHKTSQIVIRTGDNGELYTSIKDGAPQTLSARVFGKTFQYSGSSFFQVNYSILESFVGTVKDFLTPAARGDGKLLDLYCGVGLFSISFAGHYETVVGIEEGKDAVQFAKANAVANGITNTQFFSGRTEEQLSRFSEMVAGKCHVVVDPPRVGMQKEAALFLTKMPGIEKLVYVSCNPATLIRDLQVLKERFDIKRVQPVDLFPQTRHLETVVLLLPKS